MGIQRTSFENQDGHFRVVSVCRFQLHVLRLAIRVFSESISKYEARDASTNYDVVIAIQELFIDIAIIETKRGNECKEVQSDRQKGGCENHHREQRKRE